MIKIDDKRFGIEVNKRLLDINMKRSELARRMGISYQYLYDILNDKRVAEKRRKEILEIIESEALQG